MRIVMERSVDPATGFFRTAVEFDAEDISTAFEDPTDPNELLYYNLFGPGWFKLPPSGQLGAMKDFALILESAIAGAEKMQFKSSPPEKK